MNIGKLLVFSALAFSLLLSPSYAFIIYNTTIENDIAYTDATIGLSAESPVNFWDIDFLLPNNSEVVSVKDTIGPITQYSQNGKSLAIKSNSGPSRSSEIITVSMKTRNILETTYDPLNIIKLSYSGFESESTFVKVQSDKKMIASNIPFGFAIDNDGKSLTVSGNGPVNLIISTSNFGKETQNYVVIGEGNVSEADKLNQIVPRIIGMIPYYNKFPLRILPESRYQEDLDDFSAGTYKTGGFIVMPEDKIGKKGSVSIILHETTHAYNDQILRWSQAQSGWFDEGTATYIGWAANQLTGTSQPELFGDDVVYYEGLVKYTLPPEGNKEDLWNYYRQDKNYMRYWNSRSQQDEVTRRFGYAFSQLMIRYYVYKNGPEAVHELYRKLNQVNYKVESDDEYTQIVLNAMGMDMKPCYYADRSQFDACLDAINEMKAEVPEVEAVRQNYGSQVDTENLLNQTFAQIEKEKGRFSVQKILFAISDFVERVLDFLKSLFN